MSGGFQAMAAMAMMGADSAGPARSSFARSRMGHLIGCHTFSPALIA